ncbi:MAG: ImmA/IrrE family metallo-endopeptidase [Candidatus Anammoxibacter sp.]
MISLSVDYLSYDEIAQKAKEFLYKHNPKNDIPVQIEDIIELDFKMDIIPIPNILTDYDIDGFIYSDFSGICVDGFIYEKRPTRYRFTLAHEIGHYILHKNIFKEYSLRSTQDWKNFITNLKPSDHSKIEHQGYCFAGLVLVPPSQLKSYFKKDLCNVSSLVQEAQNQGKEKSSYLSYAITYMAKNLSNYFYVSAEVVEKRIIHDKLHELIP